MQCGANRELIEKFKQETPDKETPEQVENIFQDF